MSSAADRRSIERLERELAEKTVECERWKDCHAGPGTTEPACGACTTCLCHALAESQAREADLREALEESRRISREAVIAWASTLSVGADGALRAIERTTLAALSLKADNSALVEVCERVFVEAFRAGVDNCSAKDRAFAERRLSSTVPEPDLKAIIARVLGGGR